MVRHRYRLRLEKRDDLRWISHRDLARLCERWLRRAELPLKMSEGFHPKPKISFPSALALGIVGMDEVLEFELTEIMDEATVEARLAEQAPDGLHVTTIRQLDEGTKKAQVVSGRYRIQVPPTCWNELRQAIEAAQTGDSWCVSREGRDVPVDLRASVDDLQFTDGQLCFRLQINQSGAARPREVLAALGLAALETEGCVLTRNEVEVAS